MPVSTWKIPTITGCSGASEWVTLMAGLHLQDKVIIGLAFDCVDKMVYWTDISEPSIGRASLHGGEPTTIIRQGGQANTILPSWFGFWQPQGLLEGEQRGGCMVAYRL